MTDRLTDRQELPCPIPTDREQFRFSCTIDETVDQEKTSMWEYPSQNLGLPNCLQHTDQSIVAKHRLAT